MFGYGKQVDNPVAGKADATADIVVNMPVYDQTDFFGAANDTHVASCVSFPTPWTSRTTAAIPRVKSAKMWGNEEPGTWGGPWK